MWGFVTNPIRLCRFEGLVSCTGGCAIILRFEERAAAQSRLMGFVFCSRGLAASTEMDAVQTKPRFHLDLWLTLIVQNWLLDVGRPVAMVTAS